MLAAQTPNLAGVWTPVAVPAPPGSSGGTVALPPSDLTVRQTASSITLETTAFGQVRSQTYTWDGAENTNRSGATTQVTRSRWNAGSLVTEGKISQVTSQGYDEWAIKEVRSLDAKGQLIVARESVGMDGKKTSSTMTYRRIK